MFTTRVLALSITSVTCFSLNANAQVSIQSVYRSLFARTSLEALSDNLVLHDSDFVGDIAEGFWSEDLSLSPVANGLLGDGTVDAETSQWSHVGADSLSAHLRVFASARSNGVCTANGDASAVFDVQFAIPTRTTAVLHAATQNVNASVVFTLGLIGAPPVVQSRISHDLSITLVPGVYRYRVEGRAGATCSALCNLEQEVVWDGTMELSQLACPCDLNGDGVVDDADFVVFRPAYAALECPSLPALCPSDFTGDGVVNDDDFSVFIVAYDQMLCP